MSSPANPSRVLLDVLGVLLRVAGASLEQEQVTGEADVVELLAVALAAHGVALLPAALVVEV